MAKSAVLVLTWVDRSDEFYNNTVAAVARTFRVRQAALFQPVRGPRPRSIANTRWIIRERTGATESP
jgi:hypothetical protein